MMTDFRAPTPRGSNSRLACATTRARLWPSPLDKNASTKPDGRCSKGSAQVTSHFSAALDQHYPQAVMFSLYACSRVNSRREFRSETNPAARAAMNTLYDLLGALPHDNAEALRAAFRRAVKGAHPDVRPDDPEAALKFREIVRANDILGDDEQRAAYDHLLELARLEQLSEARHAIAARVHNLASGVIAMAGASVVTVGGYLLFMHMSVASVAPAMLAARISRFRSIPGFCLPTPTAALFSIARENSTAPSPTLRRRSGSERQAGRNLRQRWRGSRALITPLSRLRRCRCRGGGPPPRGPPAKKTLRRGGCAN